MHKINICIFAKQIRFTMKDIQFPNITFTVEAKPWPANHVARVTSFRPVSTRVSQPRIIEAEVLAQ